MSKQINLYGDVVNEPSDINEIVDMKSLLYTFIKVEKEYRLKKFYNEVEYNEMMLNTDWVTLNNERSEKGLPKLGNQDMKKAYVHKELMDDYMDELYLELEYLRYRRLFDVALQMGFEIVEQ